MHRRSLAGLMDRFKEFSPDFMATGRELQEQAPRDWPIAPRKKAAVARKRAAARK